MKKISLCLILTVLVAFGTKAQKFNYTETWGKPGFNLVDSKAGAVQIIFSVPEFSMEDIQVQGETM